MLTLRRSSQPKILAVEDDEGILTVYRDFLKKSGYEVICATDGSEAINLLKAHPDTRLILLDLHLPGISGHELIELFDEQGRKTPVIVTSARGDILSVTRDRKSTAALSKPFQMEELRDLIELLLSSDWQEKLQVDKTEH
ncbi:MAG TPA: response regulator [Thermoanaerobaculia bacterium]